MIDNAFSTKFHACPPFFYPVDCHFLPHSTNVRDVGKVADIGGNLWNEDFDTWWILAFYTLLHTFGGLPRDASKL
jgi:hypothetical protein